MSKDSRFKKIEEDQTQVHHRLDLLEKGSDTVNVKVERCEIDILRLRDSLHDANGHLNAHNGKLTIIETQQNTMVSELILIRQDIREWIEKVTGLLNWQLSLKFMLVGGLAVGTVMVGGAWGIFKLYLDYLQK